MAEKVEIDVVLTATGEKDIQQLSASLRSMMLATNGSINSVKNLDARQRMLNQALGNTGSSLGQHAKTLRQTIENQSALSAEIARTTKNLKGLKASLAISRSGGMPDLVRDLDLANKNLKNIKAKAIVSDLRGVGLEMRRLGKDAQFVGRSLIIGLTMPLLAFGRKALSAFYSLDKETVRLTKLLGALGDAVPSSGEIEGFKALGVEIGKTTTRLQAIEEASLAISNEFAISRELIVAVSGDFAELGINAADVVSGLARVTAQVSILGNMDVSESQTLTQTMFLGTMRTFDMMGRTFETAAKKQEAAMQSVTSSLYIFNAIENATALSFRDLADALPEVSAAATQFGLTFAEMAAMLAPMKAAGIEVGASANSIKVSLQRMVAPTKANADMLKTMGDAYEKTTPGMKQAFENIQGVGVNSLQGLIDVTAELEKTTSEEGVLKFYAKLFGVRQGTRMLLPIQDLVSFQKGLEDTKSAQYGLIKAFNDSTAASMKMTGAMVPEIKNVADMAIAARIATAKIPTGESEIFIDSLGKAVTQKDIDAAKKARKALRDYIESEEAQGRNAIENITSEAGKAMAIQLAGASNAADIATQELGKAKDAVSFSIDKIKISFKNLAADMIKVFGPKIKQAAVKIQELVAAFMNLSPTVKTVIASVLAFVAGIGPLVFIFGQIRLASGVALGSLLKFIPGIKNLTIESIAGAEKLRFLKNGLTLTGDTVVNTNTKFATLVATMASGDGPIASMARKFGEFTGMLSKTSTAADDVIRKVDAMKTSASNAIISAGAIKQGQIGGFGATSGFIGPQKPNMFPSISVPRKQVGGKMVPSGAVTQVGRANLTRGQLTMLDEEVKRLFATGGQQFNPKAFPGRQLRKGGLFAKMPKGVSVDKIYSEAMRNLARAEMVGTSSAAIFAQESAVLKGFTGTERVGQFGPSAKKFRSIGGRGKGKSFVSKTKALAGLSTADLNSIVNERVQALLGAGVEFDPSTGENIFGKGAKRRSISAREQRALLRTGVRGKIGTAIVKARTSDIVAETVGKTATKVGGVVKKGAMDVTGISIFKKGLQGARVAQDDLLAKHALLGKAVPGTFRKAIFGVKGFTVGLNTATKATKLLRIAMISTGIGAVLLLIAGLVIMVVKNFDKIRTVAKPGIDSLKKSLKVLIDIGKALLAPFLDFFASFSGADKGVGKAESIGLAFNNVAEAVKSAATAVQGFVNDYVVPLIYRFLQAVGGAIKGIVNIVKGVISIFKGDFKKGFGQILKGIMQWGGAVLAFLGPVFAILSDIVFKVAEGIVQVFEFSMIATVNIIRKAIVLGIQFWRLLAVGVAGVAEFIPNALGMGIRAAGGIIEGFVNFVLDYYKIIAQAFVRVAQVIPDALGAAIRIAGGLIASFVEGIGKAVDGVSGFFSTISGGLIPETDFASKAKGVKSFFNNIGNSVSDFGDGMTGAVDGFFDGLKGKTAGISDFFDGIGNSVSGFADGLTGSVDGFFHGLIGNVNSVADDVNSFIGGFSDSVDNLGETFGNFLRGIGGSKINEGAGKDLFEPLKKDAEDLDLVDPFIDAGGEAGEGFADAAGEKMMEAFKDLAQKLVDLVQGSLSEALGNATDKMTEALEKQKDAALSAFDAQIETINKLEKAEESLTREQEYQAERREMIQERALQVANYQRNRALAIYEGRIDDARVLSLEELKNSQDYSSSLRKTDASRAKDLAQENRDAIKDAIKEASDQTAKFFEETIANFQNAAKEITKIPPVTLEEYKTQLDGLNEIAKTAANENGKYFADAITSMATNINTIMPNQTVGAFTTGLDLLVATAVAKYGLGAGAEDNTTIIGSTIGMLAGINNQIVGSTEGIVSSFGEIFNQIQTDTTAALASMKDVVIIPALDAIEKTFVDNDPFKVFTDAVKNANIIIMNEMRSTVGHVASAVDEMALLLKKAVVDAGLAQAAIDNATGKGGPAGGTTGGPAGGTTGGPAGGSTKDTTGGTPPPSSIGSTYGAAVERARKRLNDDIETKIQAYPENDEKKKIRTHLQNVFFDVMNGKYTLAAAKGIFAGSDSVSTRIRNILSLSYDFQPARDIMNMRAFQNGGRVPKFGYGGFSTPGFDSQSVPAMLHGGEFVINAGAVKNIGMATLQTLNNMRFNKPDQISGQNATSHTSSSTTNIYVENFIGEDEWFNSMIKQYNMNVLPNKQKSAGMENRVITSYSGLSRGR